MSFQYGDPITIDQLTGTLICENFYVDNATVGGKIATANGGPINFSGNVIFNNTLTIDNTTVIDGVVTANGGPLYMDITGDSTTSGVATTADNFTGLISGDVNGSFNTTQVVKLQGTDVSSNVPVNGNVLVFNGTAWEPNVPTDRNIACFSDFLNVNSGAPVTPIQAAINDDLFIQTYLNLQRVWKYSSGWVLQSETPINTQTSVNIVTPVNPLTVNTPVNPPLNPVNNDLHTEIYFTGYYQYIYNTAWTIQSAYGLPLPRINSVLSSAVNISGSLGITSQNYQLVSYRSSVGNTIYSNETPDPEAMPNYSSTFVTANFNTVLDGVITHSIYDGSNYTTANLLISTSKVQAVVKFINSISGLPVPWVNSQYANSFTTVIGSVLIVTNGDAITYMSGVYPGLTLDLNTGFFVGLLPNDNAVLADISVIEPSFVTQWTTTLPNDTIRLPVGGVINFNVDWGDGNSNDVTNIFHTSTYTHTYTFGGVYLVTIIGYVEKWQHILLPPAYNNFLTDVISWGAVGLTALNFANEDNIVTFTDTSSPPLTITNMSQMFRNTANAAPNTTLWDTSNVTNMSEMFYGINSSVGVTTWDVSNVTDMSSMFYGVGSTPDVSAWDVSNVTNMSQMFAYSNISPDVSGWDVSNVTNMFRLFIQVTGPVNTSTWNTSSVTNMSQMFSEYANLLLNVTNWDVSNVTNMAGMFYNIIADPDVSLWDVSSVENFSNMFELAAANPDVSNWNMSSATTINTMFANASTATPNTSTWNTTNITNMRFAFSGTIANPDVSNWNVSNVTDMTSMFSNTIAANPDVSNWNVSNVANMNFMFSNAVVADPDISSWILSPTLLNIQNMFANCTLSTVNYDSILVVFNSQTSYSGVSWATINANYSAGPSAADTARTNLLGPRAWTFADLGPI
jgi:surface protein